MKYRATRKMPEPDLYIRATVYAMQKLNEENKNYVRRIAWLFVDNQVKKTAGGV